MTTKQQQTYNEMVASLTGFEELAITEAFGDDIGTLMETKATFSGRALIFVAFKRQGQSAKDAKTNALNLTLKQVGEWWAEDEIEADEEQPITEPGKDADASA